MKNGHRVRVLNVLEWRNVYIMFRENRATRLNIETRDTYVPRSRKLAFFVKKNQIPAKLDES